MRRATGTGEVKSKAKPLREVSRNRVNPTKTVIKKNKKTAQSAPQTAGEDNEAVDRLLSVHRDLSTALHQVDELVMQAFKAKPTNKQVTQEIESFASVLSEFLCSLNPWVPKFQKILSGVALEPENLQSTRPLVTQVQTVACQDVEHGDKSPNPSLDNVEHGDISPKPSLDVEHPDRSCRLSSDVEYGDASPKASLEEPLVSPSPLVAWRAAAGTIPGASKQLFLLTPQPRTGIPVTKGQSLQNAVAFEGATDHTPHLPFASIGDGNMLLGELINPASCSFCISVDKENTCIDFSPVFPKIDYSAILSTPRLKASPPKSCVLLEPAYEFSLNNFDSICKPTPLPSGTRIVSESPNPGTSGGKVAEMLDLKYPVIVGLDSTCLLKDGKKQLEMSPTWAMSPPKTCTLMEPPDEKSIKDAPWTYNPYLSFDPAGVDDVGAHCQQTEKVANDGENCSRSAAIESAPMLKASESTVCKGKQPGENTLKKELWTRFEAVSAVGVRPNSSDLQWTAEKGFLDRLEEASFVE